MTLPASRCVEPGEPRVLRRARPRARCRGPRWVAVIAAMAGLLAAEARAHQPSDSYLSLDVRGSAVGGRWDIALRDLDFVLDLDTDADRKLTWGEVRSRLPEVETYAMGRLEIAADGNACTMGVRDRLIDTHTDGAYLVLKVAGSCPRRPHAVNLRYALLFDVDATHRGLLKLDVDGASHSAVLAPERATVNFAAQRGGGWRTLGSYLASGMHHIWTGYDHMLFLCSLLLPSVAVRRGGRWLPAPAWKPVALDVLRTVTAFTVAHSITLLLAALGVVNLPSRWVEAVIAFTVVLAALNNVFTVVDARRWLVALVFGLVHGFGFASVLGGLDLPTAGDRALALLGFNLGVEAGQIAVVVALLPVLYAIRGTMFFRRAVLVGGSCAVAAVATIWLVERALDVRLLPFS